ncbi:helix-turn-helix domain-containing protein [Streptomyces sp. NPDC003042]
MVGLDTAAANGKHGGRPPAVDGDMLAVALRRRDAKESVTTIASHLGVGRSTLYRTLSAYDEAIATGREGLKARGIADAVVQGRPLDDGFSPWLQRPPEQLVLLGPLYPQCLT